MLGKAGEARPGDQLSAVACDTKRPHEVVPVQCEAPRLQGIPHVILERIFESLDLLSMAKLACTSVDMLEAYVLWSSPRWVVERRVRAGLPDTLVWPSSTLWNLDLPGSSR